MPEQKRSVSRRTKASALPVPRNGPAGREAPAHIEHEPWPRYWPDTPEFRAAKRAIDRVEKKFKLKIDERRQLLEALLGATADAIDRTGGGGATLPKKAPELWTDRDGRKENPIAFIRRVYAPWIGRGLTRAHLLEIDRPLYSALGVWFHRHPKDCFPGEEPLAERLMSLTTRPPRHHK